MSVERIWHASYAAGVPREIDFEKITMPEFLTRTAGRFPDVAALIFMGKKILYGELEALVNRFANALAAIGVKAGDKVAMLLPNMPQLVIANYAAMRIGAVVVMNNPLAGEEELTRRVNDSDSTVLITLDLLFPRALEVKEKTGLRSIVACHVTDYLPFPGSKLLRYAHKDLYRKIEPAPEIYEFLALLATAPDAAVKNSARWEETGVILYTDGTTGVGKGVMLTHANIACNTQQLRAWLPEMKDGKESVLAVFPFFHCVGWTGMQNLSILAGWTNILVPRPESQVVIEIMGKHKPALLPAMPEVYNGLLARGAFRKMPLSSVKGFLLSGGPLPSEAIKQLKAKKNVPLVSIYGLAETSPMVTATPWGGPEKSGTVGVPLPGTDLKIVDRETGTRELPSGEAGEVCVKGPQVMKGYCNAPEKTAAVIREGWFYTGDVGFLDEEGYLTILGRKEDLIEVNGGSIHPTEIDEALSAHAKIFDACTIGVPDEQRGETVKAYIVLRPGETADAEEFIAHCRETLTPDKVPQAIEFIDTLPRSAVGKILRHEVRELDRKRRVENKGE
jgi:long-chain acyl-CoA synthetase